MLTFVCFEEVKTGLKLSSAGFGRDLLHPKAQCSLPLVLMIECHCDLYSYSRSKLTDYFRSPLTLYAWWKHFFQGTEREIPAWIGSLSAVLFRVMRLKLKKIKKCA